MSDQNNEYNSDVPPRQGPEPSLREGGYVGGGNLVTMYQAQQGGGNESFPVLQAFQEYIDAERKQARKRVVQLSIGFAAILGLVVAGFLAAGVSMLRNMTTTNDRLVQVLAQRNVAPAPVSTPAPVLPVVTQPVPATSPVLEESIREMSRVLAKMQEKEQGASAKSAEAVAKTAPVVATPSTDPSVEALRAELAAVMEQSRKLQGEVVSLRNKKAAAPRTEGHSSVVTEALAQAKRTGDEKAASDKAAAEKVAAANEKKRAESEKIRLAQVEAEKALAVKLAADRTKLAREEPPVRKVEKNTAVAKTPVPAVKGDVSSKYPAPTKEPPVVAAQVKPPASPKNMTAQSITVKMRDGNVVPWRIFVPE